MSEESPFPSLIKSAMFRLKFFELEEEYYYYPSKLKEFLHL